MPHTEKLAPSNGHTLALLIILYENKWALHVHVRVHECVFWFLTSVGALPQEKLTAVLILKSEAILADAAIKTFYDVQKIFAYSVEMQISRVRQLVRRFGWFAWFHTLP